jgi:hypothetical protein
VVGLHLLDLPEQNYLLLVVVVVLVFVTLVVAVLEVLLRRKYR